MGCREPTKKSYEAGAGTRLARDARERHLRKVTPAGAEPRIRIGGLEAPTEAAYRSRTRSRNHVRFHLEADINMRRGRGNQSNRARHKTLKWRRVRQRGKEDAWRETPISRQRSDRRSGSPSSAAIQCRAGCDKLERKLGQIRVALTVSSWAYSPGLQTPE